MPTSCRLTVAVTLLLLPVRAGAERAASSDIEASQTSAPVTAPQLTPAGERKTDLPFDKLAAMFDSGAAPQPNMLPGWHTGRMFRAKDPGIAVSVLLTAEWKQPSAASKRKILLVHRLEDESPVFFDRMDTHSRRQVEAELAQRTTFPRTYVGRNCFYVLDAGGASGEKMFIRQHGRYLVFKGFDAYTRQVYYGYVTGESR